MLIGNMEKELAKKVRLQLEGLRKAHPDCMFKYNNIQSGVTEEFLNELNGILGGDMAKTYPQLKLGKYYYKQFREDRDGDTPQSFSIFNIRGIYLNPDVEEEDENIRYIDTALVYQLEGYSICSSIRNCALSIVPLRYLDTSGECEQLESLITSSEYIINDMSGLRSGFEEIIPTTKKNFERIHTKFNKVCKDECFELKKLMKA